MAAPPPPPRGLSLYENLHDPNDPSPSATISSGPVLYSQSSTTSAFSSAAGPLPKKPIDPALRFQPTRRPQPPKPKPKPAVSKSIPKPPAAAPTQPPPPPPPSSDAAAAVDPSTAAPASKSTLADWAATEDDEWLYGTGEKRPRGGRKAKKKRQAQQQQRETDWDDVYDASRPTNVEEYLRSDEKIDEVREWKALLYGHRRTKAPDSGGSSDEDERPGMHPNNQFAPPPSYAAVPPPPSSPPTTSAPLPPTDDASGGDAYARRLALSSTSSSQPLPPSSSTTISAAPILYTQQQQPSPPPPPRSPSSRPGQAGFAHRLMAKYGWTSGSGLGAASSGIVNPLRVQVEKRRKKADADGGGWAEPANKGKIIGGGGSGSGSRRKDGNDDQQQGLSNVIVLLNMLDNMPDLAAEVEDGLGQEIGEECGEKYGRVERVCIDTETQRVFIKFTDQISALKASASSMVYLISNSNMVQAVSELQGRVFNGNTITPKYYNDDAFDRGVYTKYMCPHPLC
ncbi:hypothetical protein MY11210_008256, partial [Beauveria gryllotalpidicola]